MQKPKEKRRNFVLDPYTVLVFLQREPGWQGVRKLFRRLRRSRARARLNWINWGEIYYLSWKYFGKDKAGEVRDLLAALPIDLDPVDFEMVQLAAQLKAEHNISYGDAFCAATAIRHQAVLVTADPEFKALENRIDITWL